MSANELPNPLNQKYLSSGGDLDLASEIFQSDVASHYQAFQQHLGIARQALEDSTTDRIKVFSHFYFAAKRAHSAAYNTTILFDAYADSDRFLMRGLFLDSVDILLQASRQFSTQEAPKLNSRFNIHEVLARRAEESFSWLVEDLEWRSVPRLIEVSAHEIALELDRSQSARNIITTELTAHAGDRSFLEKLHFSTLATIQRLSEFAVTIPLPEGFDPEDYLMSDDFFRTIDMYRDLSTADFQEPRKQAIVELCQGFWLLADINKRLCELTHQDTDL